MTPIHGSQGAGGGICVVRVITNGWPAGYTAQFSLMKVDKISV
jgi:hypothetical protein